MPAETRGYFGAPFDTIVSNSKSFIAKGKGNERSIGRIAAGESLSMTVDFVA